MPLINATFAAMRHRCLTPGEAPPFSCRLFHKKRETVISHSYREYAGFTDYAVLFRHADYYAAICLHMRQVRHTVMARESGARTAEWR